MFYSNGFYCFRSSQQESHSSWEEFNIFAKTVSEAGARVKLFALGVESKNSDSDHLCDGYILYNVNAFFPERYLQFKNTKRMAI